MKFTIAIIGILLTGCVTHRTSNHGTSGWSIYTNERFGFQLAYPAELLAGADPTNGAGKSFRSWDGEFTVTAQGHFLNGSSLDGFWARELRTSGTSINYKRKTSSWYVVSGVTSNGMEFYRKVFTKGDNWVEFDVRYPDSESHQYDAWVTKMEKEFRPFLEGDYDRSE